MSDSLLQTFSRYGTQAERLAFTPDPPIVSGTPVQIIYEWYETDNPGDLYVWADSGWVGPYQVSGAPGGIQVLAADPVSPADDTAWVFRDGGSPEGISLRIRLSGTTYDIPMGTI